MWPVNGDSTRDEECPKSNVACHACRRRKIRCGRQLPHCTVCERTSQVCEYPARILKSGPKIGSTQQRRKRRRADRGHDDELALSSDPNAMAGHASITVSCKPTSSLWAHETGIQENDATSGSSLGQTSSSRDFESQSMTRHNLSNIHDLSFILHPAHEAPTSKRNTPLNSTSDGLELSKSVMLSHAAYTLGVTTDALDQMITMYFDNMTAINIFHEPSFKDNLLAIRSRSQTHALLASMLAFSARFCSPECHEGEDFNSDSLAEMDQPPAYFLELGLRFVDEALKECGDEAPPLCVLQAQVLLAHSQLTQGVRGKAWRSLGTCVRLAYELNLHLIDAGHPQDVVDAKQWCDDEEKRRVWWAIWEMDVFASTVRRCPTAVDWSQIETLLPIEDEYWFSGTPRPSCYLEQDIGRRWKALQQSGNQSPKAWFIVINSLMKDAQSISSPRGIPDLSLLGKRRLSAKLSKDQNHATAMVEKAREKLEVLSNSVHCFVIALPPSLKYKNQKLRFDARQAGQISSLRQHHCGLYNIHVMTQLARLMIHHYDIFSESSRAAYTAQDKQKDKSSDCRTSNSVDYGENLAMHQYFEAADEILRIIHRSSDDHIHHINPFLSSTIWLASAVQLVRKEFGPPGTNRPLVKSKFEVLNMTYKKCVSFWDIQTAMQQNLETLESQLEIFRISGPKNQDHDQQETGCRTQTRKESWTNVSPNPVPTSTTQDRESELRSVNVIGTRAEHNISLNNISRRPSNISSQSPPSLQNRSPSRNMPAQAPALPSQLQNHQYQQGLQQKVILPLQQQQQAQVTPTYVDPLSPALSIDYMHCHSSPWTNKGLQHQHFDNEMPISPSFLHDQGTLSAARGAEGQGPNADAIQGLEFGMHMNGWGTELPSYIDELLSGACMY